MKRAVPLELAYRLINHGPVALISTFHAGRPNVCTIAWMTPLDADIVAAVVSEENYTYGCIRKTGEFAINISNAALAKKVVGCGSVSGEEVEKFSRFGLTPVKARRVKAPLVRECIGHLECRLIKEESRLIRKYNLFVARVVAASVERGLFGVRWNVWKPEARTLHHLGGNVFAVPSAETVR